MGSTDGKLTVSVNDKKLYFVTRVGSTRYLSWNILLGRRLKWNEEIYWGKTVNEHSDHHPSG